MTLYSVWQPLDDEDQRTALVFGFLRHAPPEHGLSPWLTEVLGRPTIASALEPEDFWPGYQSHVPGCTRTVPELVFEANDEDGPLHVVVEVKTGFGTHRQEQLAREVVDTAHGERAIRIALIAIGADLGAPREAPAWRAAVNAGLAEHGPAGATATVHYSSWAQLGAHVQAAGTAVPTLAVYAEDVVTQLRYNALLGYKGAPVYDDLDGLSIVNAFEVLNRSASAARQFFLLLHAQPSFHTLGLRSYWKKSFEMRRTGTSTVLTQNEEWFHVSMFMSAYKKPAWPDGAGAYAAFSFYAEDNPLLHVGAFLTTSNEVLYEYDWSDDAEILTDPRLAAYSGPDLAIKAAADRSEWLYDERPWVPGQQDSDITWTIQRLRAAASVFD